MSTLLFSPGMRQEKSTGTRSNSANIIGGNEGLVCHVESVAAASACPVEGTFDRGNTDAELDLVPVVVANSPASWDLPCRETLSFSISSADRHQANRMARHISIICLALA
jgi:hypothetical protein